MKSDIIATTVKGAFKIYLIPAMRTRTTLTTIAVSWNDLVAEARHEHAARKQAGELVGSVGEPAVEEPESRAPAAPPSERDLGPSELIVPGTSSEPQASGARREDNTARPHGVTMPTPHAFHEGQTADHQAASSSTLIEAGESRVEVRPNPAISPAHVTSGVIAHVPPDVRHKLAGNGPIRA